MFVSLFVCFFALLCFVSFCLFLFVFALFSFVSFTSSTAQGGGGSFKNRKRIGEIDCCE